MRPFCFALAAGIALVFVDSRKTEPLSSAHPSDKYKGNQDRRHNWCSWQDRLTPSDHYLKALKGANLSVVLHNGCLEDDKWLVPLMDEVARRGEFNYRDNAVIVDKWKSSDHNGNVEWMNWAVDHYDMSMEWFTIDADWASNNMVRFSYPIVDVDARLVSAKLVNHPNLIQVLLAFSKPLTGGVWLAIVLVAVFSALVYMHLERRGEIQEEVGSSPLGQSAQSLFLALGSFTGGSGFTPKTPGGKVFQLSWTFAIMLLVSAYTANLASLLVTRPTTTATISNLDEAVKQNLKVCVNYPTFISKKLQDSYPDVRTKREDSTRDQYVSLLQKRCAGLVDASYTVRESLLLESRNPLCNLDTVGPVLWHTSGGWATRVDMHGEKRCTDFLMNVVSIILQEIKVDGTLHEIMDNWMQSLEDQNECTLRLEEAEEKESHSLGISDMGGIFCIHVFFSAMAVLVGTCGSDSASRKAYQAPLGDGEVGA